MKRTRLKKFILLVMMVALVTASFSGCKKEPEAGTIDDVDLSVPKEEESEKNVFTKYMSPYDGYEYDKVKFRVANMQFDVPVTWGVNEVNSRYISILTPDDDPLLPGVTINVLASYGSDVDTDEYSGETNNDNSRYFSNLFKEEIPGLTFTVDGKRAHLRHYVAEDAIHNGLDFAGGEGSYDATTLESENITMVDSGSNYYSGQYTMVATYVKWDHSPYCFVAVVPKAYIKIGRQMLEYMASSITYLPYPSEGCRKVSYDEVSMEVPNSFLPEENAENFYTSDLWDNSSTAGMMTCVLRADGYTAKDITADVIRDSLCPKIGDIAYGKYGYRLYDSYDVTKDESESLADYTGIMILTPNCSAEDAAGGVFGVTDTYNADYFIEEVGDYVYIISFTYHPRQAELAKKVEERVIGTFKVNEKKAKKSDKTK